MIPELVRGGLEDLRNLIYETGAFLPSGEFTLASGSKSDFYFDSKLLTLHPEGSRVVGECFLDMLGDTDIEAVGGMAHGAIPIISAITFASELQGKPLPGFYVRAERKGHGTGKLVEGRFPQDNQSIPVAIIDDVVTGGDSILQAINAVEEYGNPITKVMCILDRNQGGREKIKAGGYTLISMFTIERDSQGMAYVEECRNE